MKKSFLYFTIFSLFLTTALIFNILSWKSAILGTLLGLLYLLHHGTILGGLIFAKKEAILKILYGILALLAAISASGAVIYYFWHLRTNVIIALITIIAASLLFFYVKKQQLLNWRPDNLFFEKNYQTIILTIFYLALLALSFKMLSGSATQESIRSPWEAVPNIFFAVYFLLTLLLIVILSKTRGWLAVLLVAAHTFLSLTVALFVYSIGFGFDPFIHRATEKAILETGMITPKPLYYLGQYSLVVFLAKIFSTGPELIDKLMLPLLVSVYLPATIYVVFKKSFGGGKIAGLLGLAFLSIPFDSLVATTPQGLANFFIAVALLLSFAYVLQKNISFWLLFAVATAAILIHPLSGIPFVIFASLLFLQKINSKSIRRSLTAAASILSAVALPAVFILQAKISNNLGARLTAPVWKNISWQLPALARKFQTWLDFAYTYKINWVWIFIALAAYGCYLLRDKKHLRIFPLTFIILIINYLFLKLFVGFRGLIYYEQGEFADRLLNLSWYFLLPLFLYALYDLALRTKKSPLSVKAFFVLLLAAAITSSLYLSYPRRDDYEPSRGFNVSASDIQAVHFIKNSSRNDYIVMANQMVGAAALKEFGFYKYYQTAEGELFYYPIPTGGKLYDFYLDMVYKKASREIMNEAMKLTGVDESYLVINNYWWRAPIIIEEAKNSADEWTKINNGKLWVFKYER